MGRGGPAKILVVEDDEHDREIIRGALEGRGYQLLEACDADSAVVMARQQRPDLVFLDLRLSTRRHEYEGLRVLELVKREQPEVRVLVCTAYGVRELQERAQAAGCDEFLVKPFDLGRLREVTARLLGAASDRPDIPKSKDCGKEPGSTPCREHPKT